VRAYANALEPLHRKYPDDREAEILYAYALSALGAPTDQTFAYQLKAGAILEKLLVELPNHPGVMHYRAGAAVDDLFFKPHAMDFPVHSYLQTGQDMAAKLVIDEAARIKIVTNILDAYAIAAMPVRYAVERRRWGEAAALTLPQPRECEWSLSRTPKRPGIWPRPWRGENR
jgi:hypothetical protein